MTPHQQILKLHILRFGSGIGTRSMGLVFFFFFYKIYIIQIIEVTKIYYGINTELLYKRIYLHIIHNKNIKELITKISCRGYKTHIFC